MLIHGEQGLVGDLPAYRGDSRAEAVERLLGDRVKDDDAIAVHDLGETLYELR